MPDRTCSALGCTSKPRGRDLCAVHYREARKASAPPCTVPDCGRREAAKGWCMMHYKRDRKGIALDAPVLGHRKAAGCTATGCDRPHHSGGFCTMHYQRADPAVGQVRRCGCLVTDCDLIHFGSGYCRAHYSRHIRGQIGPRMCANCGAEFRRPIPSERPAGARSSYYYCAGCWGTVPAGFAQLRRDRLAVNNVGMTDQDHADGVAYREILALDPCVYCGASSEAIDHVQAVMRGGSDRWENLAPICKSCNSTKQARSVLEMLMVRAC